MSEVSKFVEILCPNCKAFTPIKCESCHQNNPCDCEYFIFRSSLGFTNTGRYSGALPMCKICNGHGKMTICYACNTIAKITEKRDDQTICTNCKTVVTPSKCSVHKNLVQDENGNIKCETCGCHFEERPRYNSKRSKPDGKY